MDEKPEKVAINGKLYTLLEPNYNDEKIRKLIAEMLAKTKPKENKSYYGSSEFCSAITPKNEANLGNNGITK